MSGAEDVAVGVLGAAGRMGRMLIQAVTEARGARLAAAVERPGAATLGEDAGRLAGVGDLGVAVGGDLDAALGAARVLIDFTTPAATREAAARAAARGVALVIGTTGLGAEDDEVLARAAEKVPIVRSANMSLGVNVVLGLLERAARALGDAWEVELVELHHHGKKDSPSGTALAMADVVARAQGKVLAEVARHGREGLVGERPQNELGLHAVRGGDVVGEHTVYFFGAGERVEISHRATSRAIFAHGAVRAACWVVGRPPGLYDMQDVLGLK